MPGADLLERPLVGVFAVVRPDGRIHATPLWYLWDGEALHLIVERDSPRHRWTVRTGRAAVCVETVDRGELDFVTVEGPVTVAGPVTREFRYELWKRYVGPSRAREVVDAGGEETKVELVLRPEKWTSG